MSLIVFQVPFLFFVFLFPREAGRFQDRKDQLFNSEKFKKTKRRVLSLHLYVIVSSSLRKMLILSSLFLAMQTPEITLEPQSPLKVVEGQSVTLNWTYNLNGDQLLTTFGVIGESAFARKTPNLETAISDEYSGRVRANLTDSFSSITFLAVNGSTDSKTYIFQVFNSGGSTARSTVVIEVQGECKTKLIRTYTALFDLSSVDKATVNFINHWKTEHNLHVKGVLKLNM